MVDIAMVVSNRYDPDPRVHKEAASLVAAGHRVRVYAFDRMHERRAGDEVLDGVYIHRLRTALRPYGDPLAALRGVTEFRSLVRRELQLYPPAVVHCHDQDTCALGLEWKLRRRARFVFDAHDFYWTYLTMGGHEAAWRHAAARALKLAHRGYAHSADLLITVTEGVGSHPGTAELYRSWGVEPTVIWNAPPQVSVPPSLPQRFTVGYYGFVREPAMFEWLLAAIERLPQAQRPALRIAGGGTSDARVSAAVKQAASRLGIDARVTGPFAIHELPGLMAECSVQYCVYPHGLGNVERSLPVKLMDAVAHGRLAIGNADTLMGDFIERYGWGWVVREGDVAGLAQALSEAHARTTNRTQALELDSVPTWEAQAQTLVEAYNRLLGTPYTRSRFDP